MVGRYREKQETQCTVSNTQGKCTISYLHLCTKSNGQKDNERKNHLYATHNRETHGNQTGKKYPEKFSVSKHTKNKVLRIIHVLFIRAKEKPRRPRIIQFMHACSTKINPCRNLTGYDVLVPYIPSTGKKLTFNRTLVTRRPSRLAKAFIDAKQPTQSRPTHTPLRPHLRQPINPHRSAPLTGCIHPVQLRALLAFNLSRPLPLEFRPTTQTSVGVPPTMTPAQQNSVRTRRAARGQPNQPFSVRRSSQFRCPNTNRVDRLKQAQPALMLSPIKYSLPSRYVRA